MTRKLVRAALAAALATTAPTPAPAQMPRKTMPPDDVLEANALAVGLQAYVFGVAPVMMQSLLHGQQQGRSGATQGVPAVPLNALARVPRLASPGDRGAALPNVNTLYGTAWLDLAREPVVVAVPPMPEAIYWNASFADAYASAVFVASTKGFGAGGVKLFVHGPGYLGAVPKGMVPVACPTPFALMVVRIAPRSIEAGDVAVAARYQDEVKVAPYSRLDDPGYDPLAAGRKAKLVDPRPSKPDPLLFLAILTEWTTLNPPGPEASGLMGFWRRLGIGPGAEFKPDTLSRAERAGLERGLEAGSNLVALDGSWKASVVNGWSIEPREGPGPGNDPVQRAAWSLRNVASLPPAEAIFVTAQVDSEGDLLSGERAYLVHFAREQIPKVQALWSLTLYETPSLQLHPNAQGRFQVGTQVPGMRTNADGSLDVVISAKEPSPDLRGNWIPAPDREFLISLRMYLPDPEMNGLWTGAFKLPGIQKRGR